MGHHDEWQDERPVCMCPAHDDDTRIRDVTEATNVEEMMSPSAFSLIRPTIATYVAISSFYSGGWLASWRLVRVHFIIEAHDRQPSRIKTWNSPIGAGSWHGQVVWAIMIGKAET